MPIAATEGNEELSRPAVGHRELDLLWPLTPGCFSKARPNALGSSPSGGLFTCCGAAGKESFDLAKLFSKAVFGVHRIRSQPLGRQMTRPMIFTSSASRSQVLSPGSGMGNRSRAQADVRGRV